MKILRYLTEQSEPVFGWLDNNQVGNIVGSPFEHFRRMEVATPLAQITMLSPVAPGKIIAITNNYQTTEETQSPGGDSQLPVFFLKPPQSITGHHGSIYYPTQTNELIFQAELAVVIGKTSRWVPLAKASSIVFGYACAATFYARDLLTKDGVFRARAFGFDSFTALGPWIETEMDPNDVVISASVNRSLVQLTTSHEMNFTIAQLIAYLTSIMTLSPGDVILTGPIAAGVPVKIGDRVQVEVEGVGTLENFIEAENRSV
jgi:2-keto-4-pentenoate hydratase/2-oxohepta-3-ene-1,7-dioic acid hydratase in catechol pathway